MTTNRSQIAKSLCYALTTERDRSHGSAHSEAVVFNAHRYSKGYWVDAEDVEVVARYNAFPAAQSSFTFAVAQSSFTFAVAFDLNSSAAVSAALLSISSIPFPSTASPSVSSQAGPAQATVLAS